MSAAALRALLAGDRAVAVPGVWDALTATLAVRAGHGVAHLSGAACSALDLGLPDLGYVHGTHIAARAAGITPALRDVPLIADADTGYGTPVHARWTAQRYAAAGIAGLHIEDQVSPKRCGHLAGKQLIPAAEAVAKVAAIADAGTGLVVIARTDAYTVAGLDEVIARCRAFAEAGADAVFPEGVTDPAELAAIFSAAKVPLAINLSEAGFTPDTESLNRLPLQAAGGVRLVLHPTSALLAAMSAARSVYAALAAHGHAADVDRMSWPDFTDLVGQNDALALDARYGVST